MVQEQRLSVGRRRKWKKETTNNKKNWDLDLETFIANGIINEWETILKRPLLQSSDFEIKSEEYSLIFENYEHGKAVYNLKTLFSIELRKRKTILNEMGYTPSSSREEVLQRKFLMNFFKPIKNRSQFIKEIRHEIKFNFL